MSHYLKLPVGYANNVTSKISTKNRRFSLFILNISKKLHKQIAAPEQAPSEEGNKKTALQGVHAYRVLREYCFILPSRRHHPPGWHAVGCSVLQVTLIAAFLLVVSTMFQVTIHGFSYHRSKLNCVLTKDMCGFSRTFKTRPTIYISTMPQKI